MTATNMCSNFGSKFEHSPFSRMVKELTNCSSQVMKLNNNNK